MGRISAWALSLAIISGCAAAADLPAGDISLGLDDSLTVTGLSVGGKPVPVTPAPLVTLWASDTQQTARPTVTGGSLAAGLQVSFAAARASAQLQIAPLGVVGGVTDPDRSRSVTAPTAPAHAELIALWQKFLLSEFPMRHIEIVVGGRQPLFERFLQHRFPSVDYLNRVLVGMGEAWKPVARWQDVKLTPTAPSGPLGRVWMDFVRSEVPVGQWRLRDTLPELAFQKFALGKYGSVAGINAAYGLKLTSLQQLGVPFRQALLVTFAHKQWGFFADNLVGNYVAVFDYLVHRGLAVRNTVILVLLAIFITLTVNPLAAYALSRFRLRQTEKIVVFCLATMAFPAAVAAIPGFLLLRDLGLLNTFAALVLPGAANGMTIFLLKGFFDSLPQELYEAATIDGAPEWTVFWRISLPLVKPILAVGVLNAFIAAYNGWEWAIIVAQDPKIWTIAVWTYQFSQTLVGAPYMVMAAFIVNSIPVLLVFLFCQKIILRGIILPQMK